jgi:hypothetical protein
MCRRWVVGCIAVFIVGLLFPGWGSAEQPDWPDYLKKTKKPNEFVEWGWDFRIRDERFPDALDRNPYTQEPIREWVRIRSRVFADFKLMEGLKLKTRVINESRLIESPDHYTSSNPYDRYDHTDEFIFDNLYLEFKTNFSVPITWRVGRQDMAALPGTTGPNGTGFGNGLILMDGTPGDGSRSFYFDAVRATLDLDQWTPKSSLDLIYVNNQSYAHDHIPDIARNNYGRLDYWDSEAFIAYYKNASLCPGHQMDAYYIYKTEDQVLKEDWEKSTKPGSITNTAGLRYTGPLWEGAKYDIEGAFQWGDKNGHDLRAFASQESIEQSFDKCQYKPKAKLFHVMLSGDDPDTDTVESWEQVYGRWPAWGELIGYMGGPEDGVYYFTNMHIIGGQLDMVPRENWILTGVMQGVFADENTYAGKAGFSDTGLYRGLNPQAKLTWNPTKYLSFHILYEWWFSGDYMDYPADNGDYSFFRTEMMVKF